MLALIVAAALPSAPAPRLVGEPWELKTATGTLFGTLDLPRRPGPWPVVLLHAGSGPTNRDGNGPLTRTDCLKMLGRGLAANGIAVLRIDKRGIAASAKALTKEADIRLETYADDVTSWMAALRKDKRFTRVGFLGHSEGAIIGLVAAKQAHFDAFVSLCGPGRPLQEILREQLKGALPKSLYESSDKILAELEAGRTVPEIPNGLGSLFRLSVQPYLISSFRHDPAKLIATIDRPVLVVSGATDIQVSAEDAKRLGSANAKAVVVTIPNMNHIFKSITATHRLFQLPSYTDPSLPLHPQLVPDVSAFLKRSLGGK